MNATKSNTAKYKQYLDIPLKQIKKPSSQTHWVLNLLIYGPGGGRNDTPWLRVPATRIF